MVRELGETSRSLAPHASNTRPARQMQQISSRIVRGAHLFINDKWRASCVLNSCATPCHSGDIDSS